MTAEHASRRVPPAYPGLAAEAAELESHVVWDEGSLGLAQALAEALGAPLLAGEWSRTLIDLNRSRRHRKLIPAMSFGARITANEALTDDERRRRIEAYWAPFRAAAAAAVEQAIAARGRCLHLSVHTFASRLDGEERTADIGLLYDPRRDAERAAVARWAPALAAEGFRVRRNYPYRGVADGHTTALRRMHPNARYAGLELEVNQALLPDWERVTQAIVRAST